MEENVLQDLLDLIIKLGTQLNTIEEKLDRSLRIKGCLEGETLLDNVDLCNMLGVTSRTVQRYRDLNLIKYYPIEGKIFYKSSEVLDFINSYEVGVARKKHSPLYAEDKREVQK